MMAQDNRIRAKAPRNVRHYLLPPKWLYEFKQDVEDEDAVLV